MASGVDWDTFRRGLRAANPKFVLVPSTESLGAMIYLRLPRHPDSQPETGLYEVCAVASPTFFSRCPKRDLVFTDAAGKKKPEWVRGYSNVFRRLRHKKTPTGAPMLHERRLLSVIPDAFERFDSKTFKEEWSAGRKADKDKLHKASDWLRSRSKPIPGYGMPIGWQKKRIFSAPGMNPGRSVNLAPEMSAAEQLEKGILRV